MWFNIHLHVALTNSNPPLPSLFLSSHLCLFLPDCEQEAFALASCSWCWVWALGAILYLITALPYFIISLYIFSNMLLSRLNNWLHSWFLPLKAKNGRFGKTLNSLNRFLIDMSCHSPSPGKQIYHPSLWAKENKMYWNKVRLSNITELVSSSATFKAGVPNEI